MKIIDDFMRGQKRFGEDISVIVNSILLTLVYIIGVGLTSITAKLAKKNFLDLKIDKEAKTYWSELNLGKGPIKDYFRQF